MQPHRAEAVAAELEATREDALAADEADDQETLGELHLEWQGRLRRLLAAQPGAAVELRRLLDELEPGSATGPAVTQHADASGDIAAEEDGALLSLPSECVRFLGPDHTVTLGAHHNHAWALYLLGLFEEADQEIRLVTEAYGRRFGPDYPIALSAQQLLSRTQAARGNLDAAIELMTDVVARRERGLGPDRPFTLASRRLLSDFTSGR
ncbi:tetratricopeptide repeat protein [Streptomyces sp. NTH33]|uniref:tetratricopeptide repeat protein n=1 Tax=Streptomyces sp. NTH33 TaxID=1735453 RepID=UPI0015E8D50E|nr:tetratricopeptide repeat protein [Streptomyces sp. NTH33]